MPYSLNIETQSIVGATVGAAECVPEPLCDCLTVTEPSDPPEGYCSPNVVSLPDDCDAFDPDCVPRWYLQSIVDRYSSICSAYSDIFGSLFDTDPPTPPPLAGGSLCAVLPCLISLLGGREGDFCRADFDDCTATFTTAHYSPWCCEHFQWWFQNLFASWALNGAWYTFVHCLELDIQDNFRLFLKFATVRTVTVNQPSCDTVALDACGDCTPG